ncbi:MAG: GntR family transcriptional regulator, partial [Candidatus Eremiobacteraeota bacterium]|nr:GntR family transcriptional regulator [Candidatus Eremiobacteraeota bacterium]
MLPVYVRVADKLEAKIARQPAGSELPSENELARTHKISRLTARASLEELERRYLVRRTHGKRRSVVRRIDYIIGPNRSPSWSDGVRLAGATPHSQTERLRLRKAPQHVRDVLRLDKNADALFLSRLRYVDGVLAACADSWLATDLVPRLDVLMAPDASLHATLAEVYHLAPRRDWARAESVVAPAPVAERLGLSGRQIVSRLTGVTFSRKLGRPIEFTTSWLRTDVFYID